MIFHRLEKGPPIGPSGKKRKLANMHETSIMSMELSYICDLYFWTISAERCINISAKALINKANVVIFPICWLLNPFLMELSTQSINNIKLCYIQTSII
jgi:hypothetical protein